MATPNKPQGIPNEEEVLRLLKQEAKRKQYMQSPKAKAKRQEYQEKKKKEAKAARTLISDNPELLERLIAQDPDLAILRKKS